jgi:hypothetical protein
VQNIIRLAIRFIPEHVISDKNFINTSQYIHSFFLNSDISVEVTGLGILDWLVSNISSWVIGLFNDEVVDAVSSQLQEYVTEILPNVDPNRVFA